MALQSSGILWQEARGKTGSDADKIKTVFKRGIKEGLIARDETGRHTLTEEGHALLMRSIPYKGEIFK